MTPDRTLLMVFVLQPGLRIQYQLETHMYECRSNDDPGAEILCNEERPRRNPNTFMSMCIDRERSTCKMVNGSTRASQADSYPIESPPISRRLPIFEDPVSHHSHYSYHTLVYHLLLQPRCS